MFSLLWPGFYFPVFFLTYSPCSLILLVIAGRQPLKRVDSRRLSDSSDLTFPFRPLVPLPWQWPLRNSAVRQEVCLHLWDALMFRGWWSSGSRWGPGQGSGPSWWGRNPFPGEQTKDYQRQERKWEERWEERKEKHMSEKISHVRNLSSK